ncbi:14100_t:CDS:10 [Entrophospora sp. SA101]|nr:14100_t:CDS:10 [Entrophospora sp. SA101]
MSDTGNHLVSATPDLFVVMALDKARKEYEVIGEFKGHFERGEKITAILCLPFFMPSAFKSQIFVIIGYNTGYLRIFTQSGSLQISQQLDTSPIISIKLRTATFPTFSLPISMHSHYHDYNQKLSSFSESLDEEITILHEGGKVVSIDGKSLWTVLRVCNSHYYNDCHHNQQRQHQKFNSTPEFFGGNGGIDGDDGSTTAFAYKKWYFEGRGKVFDVVSCGPSKHWTTHVLDRSLVSSSSSTALFSFQAKERYIAVGSNPMLSYYATSDSSKPFLSAVSIASMVANKVSNAVYSLAKTLLTAASGVDVSSDNSTVDDHGSGNIAAAKPIPMILALNDSNRKILSIVMSPAAADGKYQLAALTDSNKKCTMRVATLSSSKVSVTSTNSRKKSSTKRITLFLVIYSPFRGIVEIYHMRHGRRVGNFTIGQGWNLLTTVSSPLGYGLSGEVRLIDVPFGCAIKKQVNHLHVFKNLIRKYGTSTFKEEITSELMKILEQIQDSNKKLEALMSIPDSLPPTFHLIATQSSINCLGMLDSFDFLEYAHDLLDNMKNGKKQDFTKIIRLKIVLREHLLHIYETLEGLNVSTNGNKVGKNDYNSDNNDNEFKIKIKNLFNSNEINDSNNNNNIIKSIGPNSFMSLFILNNLEKINDDDEFLLLDDKIDDNKKLQLVNFLFRPLILSITPEEWIEAIRKRIPTPNRIWLNLFLFWFKNINVGHSLLLAFCCKYESPFIESFEIDWNNLIQKLEICWKLTKNIKNINKDIDDDLEIGLTAENLNKCEKTSITRIVAINNLYVNNMSIDLSSSYNEYENSDLSIIYKSWILCKLYEKNITRTDLLEKSIDQIIFNIKDDLLKNGLLYSIWYKIFLQKSTSIMSLIEKTHKTPKDELAIKHCGMNGETIKKFLSVSKKLLESFILDDDKIKVKNILKSVRQLLIIQNNDDDLYNKNESYYNDIIGVMLNIFNDIDDNDDYDEKIIDREKFIMKLIKNLKSSSSVKKGDVIQEILELARNFSLDEQVIINLF